MHAPPQPPPPCLTRSYTSRAIRGGTVIAEDVVDLETHRRRVLDPDGYRSAVSPCPRCRSKYVHAHCLRDRTARPLGLDEPKEVVTVRLYRCATEQCRAVFTVLPAFLARHLWRMWSTVAEAAAKKTGPRSTVRRWTSRLATDAEQPLQVLAAVEEEPATRSALLQSRPRDRTGLVDVLRSVLGGRGLLARVAAWIHRLEPGIRLM